MKTIEAFEKLISMKQFDFHGNLLDITFAYSKKYNYEKLKSTKDKKIFIHSIPISSDLDIIQTYFETFGKIECITKKLSANKKIISKINQ